MDNLAHWKGCAAPAAITATGRFVSLLPYDRDAHVQALWDAFGGRQGINPLLTYFTQDDFGSIDDFAAWLETNKTNGWVAQVFRDNATGQVVGMANYMRADPANGSVEVGGVIHGPDMARSPLSTEVHYLMAKHAFEDLGYRRYEWKCHNGNLASKRAAERLGFTFEGIFRQHMISKGANRDTAWFSMIDGDWPLLARAFDLWLARENIGEDGVQKRRLQDIRASLTDGGEA